MVWGAVCGSLLVFCQWTIGPFCQWTIGSIVLLMPDKIHGRESRNSRRSERLFELLRRLVAERRMQAAAIIVLFDEDLDVRAQMIEIQIIVGVDLFLLKRLHKTFAAGVIIRVRWPTHAGNHLVVL